MPILKNATQGNFVLISQQIMQDKTLGLTERGLLITLMSLPDGWNLTIRGLQSILPDGRDKITNGLNHLIKLGYIEKQQVRSEGRYGNNILEIHSVPLSLEPIEGKPSAENPLTDKPLTEKLPQLNNKELINKELNTEKITTKGCVYGAIEGKANGRKKNTEYGLGNGKDHCWSNAEKELYGL